MARYEGQIRLSEQHQFDGVSACVINAQVIERAQPAQQFFAAIDSARCQ